MNNIRVKLSQIKTLSKKEDIFFSDRVLRIISNDNIIMMTDIINSKLPTIMIDGIVQSAVKICYDLWDKHFELIDSTLYKYLKIWTDYIENLN